MALQKLVVSNYRTLKSLSIEFNQNLNVIVADNEVGKSTILEAVNLALTGQINGRAIQGELHPFLFNKDAVAKYINAIKEGRLEQPPRILIELYFTDESHLTRFKGSMNTLRQNRPGVSLAIEFDEMFGEEYKEFIKNPEEIRNVPIEYYAIHWRSFAGESVTARSIPLRSMLIDATNIRHNAGANRYILEIVKDILDRTQKVQLSLAYRKMKDSFISDESIKKINEKLISAKGTISNRNLSVSLDSSSKSNWENGIETQLDEIPLMLSGKGEQNSIKIKLAMEAAGNSNVLLIEEPENHLSHSNLNALIDQIRKKSDNKQVIITTHSSFVLNKLDIGNVVLLSREHKSITLKDLHPDTRDYFVKLPGHETLRLILAQRAILVEGPSDELIVQKAFVKKYGRMPLESGIDVITVNSLAFKRFLEISKFLKIPTVVVTDNDGDLAAIENKYEDYWNSDNITICFSRDAQIRTLEPQMLKANGRALLNKIFKKDYQTDDELLSYMQGNKTDCALSVFNTNEDVKFPEYIGDAI